LNASPTLSDVLLVVALVCGVFTSVTESPSAPNTTRVVNGAPKATVASAVVNATKAIIGEKKKN
jgi:hypothetical protein